MMNVYIKNTTDEEKEIIKVHSCIKFMPNLSKITDKLYLGNYDSAMYKSQLKSLGVTHILVCGNDLEELYPKDFIYMTLKLKDNLNEDIYSYFPKNADEV